NSRVVGLDFVPEMLTLAQQKAKTIGENEGVAYPLEGVTGSDVGSLALLAGDALRIPFPDGAFDAVVT
ncbi:MAG: methyltransferase domain-containing protein, partial [Anaerolineae bacterium]|nr:methyltransferase domain-containing protein [Anaerolineae bacterium]